jgi:hypothetical protein
MLVEALGVGASVLGVVPRERLRALNVGREMSSLRHEAARLGTSEQTNAMLATIARAERHHGFDVGRYIHCGRDDRSTLGSPPVQTGIDGKAALAFLLNGTPQHQTR